MTVGEFCDKWLNGSKEHVVPSFNGKYLTELQDNELYSVHDVKQYMGYKSNTGYYNLNAACRDGRVCGATKINNTWYAYRVIVTEYVYVE